jgi:hypothetical protein
VTIDSFAALARTIERAVTTARAPRDPAKLTDVVSERMDELQAILLFLQRTPRSEP